VGPLLVVLSPPHCDPLPRLEQIDTFDFRRDALVGKIVLAWNAENGLLVSRLIRFYHTDALVSDHREYESISLAPEAAWRIIGVVLWWTGKAR
jgi:hypothetical protein